ncbi:uncharacterized protein A4U43_C10F12910 [Asparagus officinalis]|uniref:Phosphoribosyltransferase domain-containing protein n=1 Tax=Asparagus officinalis TaxID=4686 RepID=A0A5P1E713_ASPOF|nr:uncharacterized protein A4U43_C10F12910 [Asparagus officinalis]
MGSRDQQAESSGGFFSAIKSWGFAMKKSVSGTLLSQFSCSQGPSNHRNYLLGLCDAEIGQRFLRNLTEEEIAFISQSAVNYVNLAEVHAAENAKSFDEIEFEMALRKKFARIDEEYDSMLGVVSEVPPELTLPNNIECMEFCFLSSIECSEFEGTLLGLHSQFINTKSFNKKRWRAKLVANLITEAGANRVLACDLRSGQSMGYFDIPVDHVDGQPVILDYLASKTICLDDLVVVSLDVGGVARARAFAKKLSDASLAIVDKRRLGHNVAEVMNLIGDVRGKVAVVVDDMIDTAAFLAIMRHSGRSWMVSSKSGRIESKSGRTERNSNRLLIMYR